MGYLRLYDYLSNIQQPVFNQVLQSNDALRVLKEAVALSLCRSYLIQEFDVDSEFTNTTVFSPTAIYNAQSLVELNYPAYDTSHTYTNVGADMVTINKLAYILKTSGATGAFDVTKWNLLGAQYDLYHIDFPYPEFQVTSFYNVGDVVFCRNKIYKCLVPTAIPDHITQLQAVDYKSIPLNNVFPDDPLNGKVNWGTGVSYSVTGLVPNATNPTAWSNVTNYSIGQTVLYNSIVYKALTANTNKTPGTDIINWQPQTWVLGDNRNAQLVECMVWVTIEKLAPLISPRNIPVFWEAKYTEMTKWLQMCADGVVSLEAPLLQPSQGRKIRWGGKVKQQNGW